jgi:Ribbon-helix-helix protein, copG family
MRLTISHDTHAHQAKVQAALAVDLHVCTSHLRRIQIYMDDDLENALEAAARAQGTSKAALIRECVAMNFRPLPLVEDDPLTALMGSGDGEPADDVDEVIYG